MPTAPIPIYIVLRAIFSEKKSKSFPTMVFIQLRLPRISVENNSRISKPRQQILSVP
jgi:hypothetical protein